MFFLLRTAFWFSLVLLALPLGTPATGRDVGPLEAIFAAREAVGDLAGFCERKPDVCETGRSAAAVIGVRAREGSRIAYELLDSRFGKPGGADETITTGTVAVDPDSLPALEPESERPEAVPPEVILPEHAPLPQHVAARRG